MKRIAPVALALCALLIPFAVRAQTAPQTYTDPAMSFTAPADFTPIPVPSSDPSSFTQPTVVAAYVRHAKQPDATIIQLRMESYTDDLLSYEQSAESAVRNQGSGDSVFVKKVLTTLPNGMPAYFLAVTVSQDAGEARIFEYVWVDHVRGVTLSVTGRFGTIDDASAKKILSNVSAVAYPKNTY